MIYIVICSEITFQDRRKHVVIDKRRFKLVDAETVIELRKRADDTYKSWCEANQKNFTGTWYYLRGEL